MGTGGRDGQLLLHKLPGFGSCRHGQCGRGGLGESGIVAERPARVQPWKFGCLPPRGKGRGLMAKDYGGAVGGRGWESI